MSIRPLENGPTRDFLEEAASELGLRYLGLFRWTPRGGGLNACLWGVGRLRLVCLSDALLAGPRDELLAALAHEAGHARLWHVEKLASGVVLGWLPSFWLPLWAWAPAFLYLVWGFLLGPVSRRFELQADAFSARVGGAGPMIALLGRIRFRVGGDGGRRHGRTSDRMKALRIPESAEFMPDSGQNITGSITGERPE